MKDTKLNEKASKVVEKLNKMKDILYSRTDDDKIKYFEYLSGLAVQLEDLESDLISDLEDVPLVNLKKKK
jgi:hypothetical protein